MKRIFACVSAVLALFACAAFASCSGEHTVHDYEWTEVKPATCLEAGLKRGVCKVCNDAVEEPIPALGHDFDEYNECRRCHYIIPVTPDLAYYEIEGGYSVGIGMCTETEVSIPAYYEKKPILEIRADGFLGTPRLNEDGSIYHDDEGKVQLVSAKIVTLTLPEGLLKIGERAFYGLKELKTVNLPQTLKEIGDLAFKECTALKTINAPRDLEVIGSGAFSGCVWLNAAIVSSNVTKLGEFAFSGCTSLLTAHYMSGKLEEVGGGVFSGCTALRQVTLKGDFALCTGAFENCTSLLSVELGTLKSVASSAFVNCDALVSVKYGGTTDDWLAVEKAPDWCASMENPDKDIRIECTNGMLSRYGFPING